MIAKIRRRSAKIALLRRPDRKLQRGESRRHPTTIGGSVMFGRQKQENLSNHESSPARGWSLAERARRRDRERAEAEVISELRWQWRSACTASSLSQMIYTPSGATRSIPTIGHVDLGPPVSFTVRMRPGQTFADFTAAAPSIAPRMGVAALQAIPLSSIWVRIVLLPAPVMNLPHRWSQPGGEALRHGA